jgi:hypothetical protein
MHNSRASSSERDRAEGEDKGLGMKAPWDAKKETNVFKLFINQQLQ